MIYEQNLRYQPKSKPLGTFYFTFCPRSNGVFSIAKIRAYSLYTKHYNSYFVYFTLIAHTLNYWKRKLNY